jgi:hypothetical protein
VLVWLRWWADLLDSKFRIPGTNVRFGIDPILSLVPGIGELASPLFTALILTQALRQRVPAVVILRMVINAVIDAAVGAVPVAGTVADVFWRANKMNLELLEQHAGGRPLPRKSDYVIFWIIVGLFGLVVGLITILGIWVAMEVWPRLVRI